MKKFLLFTASIASVIPAFAGTPINKIDNNNASVVVRPVKVNSSRISKSAMKEMKNYVESLPAKEQVLKTLPEPTLAPVGSLMAPAADEHNFIKAYYNLGDGCFYSGLYVHDGGAYFTGYAMYGQVANFNLKGCLGNKWSMTDPTSKDLSDYVDEENNLKLPVLGVGGFYGPKVASETEEYYYAGKWAGDALPAYPDGFENSIVYIGLYNDKAEDLCFFMSVYDPWECTTYVGYNVGKYAYGSNRNGVESHATLIDLGNVGGGLVIDHLQFQLISGSSCPLGEGGEMKVTIVDADPVVDTLINKFEATILPEDIELIGAAGQFGSEYFVNVRFSEEDLDGFTSEVTPVVNGSVQILIQDNAVNCDYGFLLNADDRENENDYNAQANYYYGVTNERSYWFNPTDQKFRSNVNSNATVDVVGYFNYLGGTEGEREFTVTAPVEGGYAVSVIEDGVAYNDVDLLSTFDVEYLTVVDCPDWISPDVDDSYYEEQGIIAVFFNTGELPAGVKGRSGDVVICSNDQVYVTVTVNQGEVSTDLNSVKVAEKSAPIYNLMGQQVKNTNAKGLYLINGKKVMK